MITCRLSRASSWFGGTPGRHRWAHSNASPSLNVSSPPKKGPPLKINPLQWYSSKLETHPLTTKCITAGVIAASGDILCQYFTGGRKHHSNDINNELSVREQPTSEENDGQHRSGTTFEVDWARTSRFGALGVLFISPIVHYWYGFLMARIPGTSIGVVVKRTFFDQAVFAPMFLPAFLSCLTVLEEGTNVDTEIIMKRLRSDVPDALLVNWAMWIPAQIINFAFVPGKFQVLFSNGVGFFWNAYLSWKTHEGGNKVGEGDANAENAREAT